MGMVRFYQNTEKHVRSMGVTNTHNLAGNRFELDGGVGREQASVEWEMEAEWFVGLGSLWWR
jgi:hypothetical protein